MRSFKGSGSGPVVCRAVTVNIDPANLAAHTSAYVNQTIADARVGQRVMVRPLADIAVATVSTPGYILGANPRVSADNTVRYMNSNVTAGAINPDALDVSFILFGDPSQP